jgi:MoxR-like ATPase
LEIVQAKVPNAAEELAEQVTAFVQELRTQELYKLPGVAETIDWTKALVELNQKALDERIVAETLGVILKYKDDLQKVRDESLDMVYQRAMNRAG